MLVFYSLCIAAGDWFSTDAVVTAGHEVIELCRVTATAQLRNVQHTYVQHRQVVHVWEAIKCGVGESTVCVQRDCERAGMLIVDVCVVVTQLVVSCI